jgi:penicillin-binding protein 1C
MQVHETPAPKRTTRPWRAALGILLAWLSAALLLLAADALLPPPLPASGAGVASVVLARDGSPLRAFPDRHGIWRMRVAMDEVSPLYLEALIAYEDRWFWRHAGINPLSVLRAAGQWLTHGRAVSGASTLSMQAARLIEPQAPGLSGKLRQALRALQLEWRLGKRGVLELYLNHAPFGGTIEGVEAASWAYLGKPARELSQAEAALLAVLPQSPSRLRPDRHPQRAQRARDKVLKRLQQFGVRSAREVDQARQESVLARSLAIPQSAALLAERLRRAHPREPRIASSIDAGQQRRLEALVEAWLMRLPPRSSAALLLIDNASGEVRAYVGSARFADRERFGHLDMVRAWRSPGSTLKPFVYGLALDAGLLHSGSLLVDAPQDFDGYRPDNFDRHFRGPVSVASALQKSLNVPAVAVLHALGPAHFAARLQHAGLRLRLPGGEKPNLSLVLGGTEVRLQDLVGAYAALHRDGLAVHPRLRPDSPLRERRLLSPAAAHIIAEVLKSASESEDGYFARAAGERIAFKTGTSYGFRDSWAVGGTPAVTLGVWIGRPDGTPSPGQFGAVTALPLLRAALQGLPAEYRRATPTPPPAAESFTACWPLGGDALATKAEHCHRRLPALRIAGSTPRTLAAADESPPQLLTVLVDPKSGLQRLGDCRRGDEVARELALWPRRLAPWLSRDESARGYPPPTAADCATPAPMAQLQITGAQPGSRLRAAATSGQAPRLVLRAAGARGDVTWLVNGRLAARLPAEHSFERSFEQAGAQDVVAIDAAGSYGRLQFEVMDSPSRTERASIAESSHSDAQGSHSDVMLGH